MKIQELIEQINRKPLLAWPFFSLLAVIVLTLFFNLISKKPEQNYQANNPPRLNSSVGLASAGVDHKVYMARLEKNYFELHDELAKLKDQMVQVKNESRAKRMQRKTGKLAQENMFQPSGDDLVMQGPRYELKVAHLSKDEVKASEDVYLPLGSFCEGTLLSGVYAASDSSNPLPVLIRLNAAFMGPNNSRIPLKGAFVLGKAYGDINSSRAYIQIVAISTVLADGSAFEQEQNLGYVTDQWGELGIPGVVVRRTAKELAMMFMSGFLSAGAGGFADAQVSRQENVLGVSRAQVTGDKAVHAIFSGLSNSTQRLADYYEKQSEAIVPAVHIKPGSGVYFIVQKGVRIEGLLRTRNFDLNLD